MKRILRFGVGLALAVALTTAANATLLFTWVPDTALNNNISSSGALTEINAGSLNPFSFTLDSLTTDTTAHVTTGKYFNPALGQDGNYTFTGTSDGAGPTLTWTIHDVSGTADEDSVTSGTETVYGDWVLVPVPEPTTAGCLLLGLGALACFQRFTQNRRS